MDKYQKISLLLSIFEKLGLNKLELIENEKILNNKNELELQELLQNLWLLISKQKNFDNILLTKIKNINLNLEENIDKQKDKLEIENDINF
ncbi:hypothetical protein HUU51_03665 [Candidatus Gracilibacteria bacterium]|nr:hypothetical protein [Candidatus Gracilibacteria bacterium]